MSETRPKRARYIPLLIVAVFLIPLAAAWLYRPGGEPGNHGTLIDPARPLQSFEMTDLDGATHGLEALTGKWTLLYVGGEHCGDACRTSLFNIERARLSQGEEMRRVQGLYLAPRSIPAGAVAETLVEYSGVQGYRIDPGKLQSMAPGFDWQGAAGSGTPQRVYVIDPLGNLMMFYPGGSDPAGMHKDLKRLLKVSRVG